MKASFCMIGQGSNWLSNFLPVVRSHVGSASVFPCKVEELVPVRVMIRIVEILLYLIFQSSYFDLPESQTSKLSLQNSLSFRQVWTPIVADKH
jgi:hypothetical protein